MKIKAFLGASVNGFISPDKNRPARFTSARYMIYLHKHIKSNYDMVLMTGATLRAYGSSLGGGHQVIWSRQGKHIDPHCLFFAQPSITKRTLLVNEPQDYSQNWDTQEVFTTWQSFISKQDKNINIAVLGGSALIDALIKEQLLTEIELVISPFLFANQCAAPLANCSANLKLLSVAQFAETEDICINYSLKY